MIDYILSSDSAFKNLSILIDIDGIIAQTDLAENSSKKILFADNSIELRLLFESHIRDRYDNTNCLSFIIVYQSPDATLPFDIERKCRYRSITVAALFPFLDTEVIRDLSPHQYQILFEKAELSRTASSQALSKNETAAFVIKAIYSTDIASVYEKEQLIRFLIDLHVSGESLSPALEEHILSSFNDRFIPQAQLHELLVDRPHFFDWLGLRLEEFLHTLPANDSKSDEYIDFSHPDLSMKIYHLITNGYMPKPTLPGQLLDIELEPNDQWVLLLYPHTSHITQEKETSPAQDDPDIVRQLESLKSLADVDQESFLMKTRKTMESIVNDLLSNAGQEVSSYTLFEKLKYLEDHNRLPKTTATFFHTIRKLGNLGAHEAKEIRLSGSEIETVLSMLSYIIQWHKSK
jgi:hypothetical protein